MHRHFGRFVSIISASDALAPATFWRNEFFDEFWLHSHPAVARIAYGASHRVMNPGGSFVCFVGEDPQRCTRQSSQGPIPLQHLRTLDDTARISSRPERGGLGWDRHHQLIAGDCARLARASRPHLPHKPAQQDRKLRYGRRHIGGPTGRMRLPRRAVTSHGICGNRPMEGVANAEAPSTKARARRRPDRACRALRSVLVVA